jgi:hypothetical protein
MTISPSPNKRCRHGKQASVDLDQDFLDCIDRSDDSFLRCVVALRTFTLCIPVRRSPISPLKTSLWKAQAFEQHLQ